MFISISIPQTALHWLRTGERGISSEAIFSHLTGIRVLNPRWEFDGPHDFQDFRRCELLLEAVPEFRERFGEMKTVSPYWARLVDEWPNLVRELDAVPDWRAGQSTCVAITKRVFQIRDELGI